MIERINDGKPVSDHSDLKFVMDAANVSSPECIHISDVKPALALYEALHDEQVRGPARRDDEPTRARACATRWRRGGEKTHVVK